MPQAPAVPSLMRWGLSPHADLVYRMLVGFGPRSVHYISQSLELSVPQVRAALDELAALGAASPADSVAGDDRTWSSHAPTQVVALLRERHQRGVLAQHRLRLRMTRMAHPPVIADVSRLPRDEVRRLDGVDLARARLFAELQTVRRETLTINTEAAFGTAELKASAEQVRKAQVGGDGRFVLGIPASVDDDSAWYSNELRARGGRYRELPTVPMKLFVFDRRIAWVPIDPADRSQGYWEITAPQSVHELTVLFLQHWAMAGPPRMWLPPRHLSPRESTIVTLLADGHSDAAIIARLDLSVRTIAYTVAGLMERYRVTNRFQLGLRLGAEAAKAAPDDATVST
ncbi:helix-turn-helix transcriptional regulator [Catellatospora vulcania]|uniref:helix-turn-helix transcriptional regulator n=1 Tax=Catellatospora vulcania TaxID=1460450 RepID=UPI0012D4727A|nr:helix-turn-helix transcriptional regulator [Catellatospora vulcania]